MDTLKSFTLGMNLTGPVGEILRANEMNWVQTMLDDNPDLFAAFFNQCDERIFKCMWHGEFSENC